MLSLETSLAETIRLIFDLITFIVLVTKELIKVSGQLPPEENCPRLGLGFGSKSGLVSELGATRQLPPMKIATPG